MSLAGLPAFERVLDRALHVHDLRFSTGDVPELGAVDIASWRRRVKLPGREHARLAIALPEELRIAWGQKDGEVRAFAGSASPSVVAKAASATPTLGDDAAFAAATAKLGPDWVLAVYTDPGRLFMGGKTKSALAPCFLLWGRRGDAAVVRVDLSDSAVREIVRQKLGL